MFVQQNPSFFGDPVEMARSLIKNNGLTRAIEIAMEGTTKANEERNFYNLSVWREVKGILTKTARRRLLASECLKLGEQRKSLWLTPMIDDNRFKSSSDFR